MGAVGSYQFVWSSIRGPLGSQAGAGETALGTVFTVFLVFQALSQFPAGWVRDRFGPRVPLLVAAPLLAVGYVWAGRADSATALYVAYALGGVGVGATYTVAVNTPVKWFTERRGLATGVVTMSYSGVSFLLIPAVRRGVETSVQTTLAILGVGLGAVALVGALVLRDPPRLDREGSGSRSDDATDSDPDLDQDPDSTPNADSEMATAEDGPDGRSTDGRESSESPVAYEWRDAVRTWQFWLLYVVFFVVNGAGLMLIGKVVAYADALALPAAVATASASVVAGAETAGIAIIGGLSDRLGRERTVAASLVLAGVALAATVPLGTSGAAWAFVALVGAAALFRSPAFSVFPSLVGDYYGPARSSENYAMLYTAKIPGSVFGGTVASGLVVSLGWTESFLLAAAALSLAGVAVAFLRPPEA
jgi:OFA family oxalate/formate antiporter-like MFS transporter